MRESKKGRVVARTCPASHLRCAVAPLVAPMTGSCPTCTAAVDTVRNPTTVNPSSAALSRTAATVSALRRQSSAKTLHCGSKTWGEREG